MLPGFPRLTKGQPAPQLVGVSFAGAYRGTNGSQSISISVPAEAEPGDLLLMLACASVQSATSGATNIGLTSGWTNIQNTGSSTNNEPSLRFMRRTMAGGDTTWNVATTNSIVLGMQIQAWRRVSGTLGNRQSTQTTGDTGSQIASTTNGSAMAAFAFFLNTGSAAVTVNSFPANLQFAGTLDVSAAAFRHRSWAGWQPRLTGGATGNQVFDVTNNAFTVFMLQEMLRP
jgi:hypothetical protein